MNTVNILPRIDVSALQVTVCLCGRDTCNGPSLPPREMLEEADQDIDIDAVFRVELQTNLREDFTITEKALTKAFSFLKAATRIYIK